MELKIKIFNSEIEQAKTNMKVFDSQKTYNKFKCNHNYIGLLGEMVLHRYLKNNNVTHEWIPFIKQGWNEPDFIINNRAIDLKTSYSDKLWCSKVEHDVYIHAKLSKDNKLLTITGWLPKEVLNDNIEFGVTKTLTLNNKQVYCTDYCDMLPIELLI